MIKLRVPRTFARKCTQENLYSHLYQSVPFNQLTLKRNPFDKDKAMEIIGSAYQKYSNAHFSEPYLDMPLGKRFQVFKEDLKARAKENEHPVVVEESDRHIKVRFNRCPTYEVYKDYGIPEVCQKYCDGDFEAFPQIDPKIRVTREHEIAYGDPYCDHCWTLEE